MKFLKNLLNIKQERKLSNLTLLDMAYVVSLLPLLVMLKAPMVLFMSIVLAILIFKKTPVSQKLIFFIFSIGVIAVYLSLYGAFSFRGLSRLKLFLELLVYILIIVVSMQRLTKEINFYLIISPFLFLALSLFFYHSITMLIYVIFEVFVLLWMILAHRMSGDLMESFRSTMVMFMYSLPWVVVLFIFFPRISFDHATYGFKGEIQKHTGHDGTMYIDGNALLVLSDRIVMEVGFDKEVPPASKLYFRGSTLYIDKKDHWEPLAKNSQDESRFFYPTNGIKTDYKVTLYPTQKKWLYMLDVPSMTIEDSLLNSDFISTVKKNIDEPMHYAASSYLTSSYKDTLNSTVYKASTYYDKSQNPETFLVAQDIIKIFHTKKERLSAITDFFKNQSLTYTLKPDALDINRSTDSFLFDKKRGYCVHFTSSFVTMARMVEIPSRIVTGFKADKSESLNSYLAVKGKNAHSWAELYIDKHWVRYETTATASNIDLDNQILATKNKNKNPLLKKINLYLMYTKYQVETWILYYSHIRQLQLLNYAKNNPKFIIIFVITFISLIILSFMTIVYFKRPSYSSEALAILQPLLKALKKRGYIREKDTSIHQFLLEYIEKNSHQVKHVETLKKIDILYEKILYSGDDSNKTKLELKKSVKSCLKLQYQKN